MTPSQTKKLRKFVGAWVLRQRKKMGLNLDALGEMASRSGSTIHGYEAGHYDVPFPVILTIAYEADCTIEETQQLFEAYAAIRAPGVNGKICTGCGELKPADAFAQNGGGKPGTRSTCKECVNAQTYARREARAFPPFKGYAA